MTARLRLEFFGGVAITLDNQPLQDPLSGKAQALLCHLAIVNRPQSRSALAGLLWPDIPEENARANLRKELTQLRRVLRPYILANRQEIGFDHSADYWMDVEEFTTLTTHRSDVDGLVKAAELYQGDFIADFYILDAPTFDAWVLVQRSQIREQVLLVLQRLTAHFSDKGQTDKAIIYIKQLLTLEPWREEAQRHLMELYARIGQRSSAVAQYEICRRVLAEELDVDPAPETTELYERIRRGEISDDQLRPKPMAGPPQQTIDLPAFISSELSEQVIRAPFVERTRELNLLDTHLDAALGGEGGVVFVAGEAGSGKSALVREFSRRAQEREETLIVVAGNCNAYAGIGDPYLPWRDITRMLTVDIETRWSVGSITRNHAQRLWHLFPDVLQIIVERSPLLVGTFVNGTELINRVAAHSSNGSNWPERLQSLVDRNRDSSTNLGTEQSGVSEQFIDLIVELSNRKPLLLILDDLHWADLSSVSLLFHLGRWLSTKNLAARILVVGTYRPEDLSVKANSGRSEQHPLTELIYEFQSRRGDILVDLGQLSEIDGRQFVDSLLDSDANAFEESFRNTLFKHTRGHALFTVELLQDLRERGSLTKDTDGRWTAARSLDWTTLPAQVVGIIGKRIGQLDSNLRAILTAASVEGEEFTAEVVATMLSLSQRMIVRQLSGELDKQHQLVSARGIRRLDGQRLSIYRFRHNLFQHYLYDQLDEIERVAYHEDVGNALEIVYQERAEEVAAQLAWQFERAKMPEKAIEYLLIAGRQAVRLSAYEEAIVHLVKSLDLLRSLPQSLERARQELSIQLNLGVSLQTTRGWPSQEVGDAYNRARELCKQVNDNEKHFRVLWGLQHYHVVRGELQTARELGEQHLKLAQETGDPAQLVAGHFMQAGPLTSMGEFAAANEHWSQSIVHYDPVLHQELAFRLGSDPGVFCRAWGAHAWWSLGYPDRALKMGQEALALARELRHPFSIVVALDYLAMLHQFRREDRDACKRADEAIDICTEQGFAYYLAWAQIIRGWSVVANGDSQDGAAQIEQGLTDLLATGARLREPYYLCLFAEATAKAGQVNRALAILSDAEKAASRNGERWRETEIYRLRGEMQQTQDQWSADSETAFQRAIGVARQQRAKSLELRATVSLSRYWSNNGKPTDAHALLSNIAAWFEEGFDTPDLREARALLNQLQ